MREKTDTVCFRFHFHQQVKLLQSQCLCVSPWIMLIKSAFQKRILMVKVLAMEARFDRPSLHIDPILVFFFSKIRPFLLCIELIYLVNVIAHDVYIFYFMYWV